MRLLGIAVTLGALGASTAEAQKPTRDDYYSTGTCRPRRRSSRRPTPVPTSDYTVTAPPRITLIAIRSMASMTGAHAAF